MHIPSCDCCAATPRLVPFRVPGRRGFLGLAASGVLAAGLPAGAAHAADPVPRTTLTPDQALARMKEGNTNFRADTPVTAGIGRERRLELARGQAPFCILVGCSDSRVSPELLFGRGLGELFIVRNAGNTVDTAALGSIEYGVGVLGVPLIVVLGHESCGAVAAAVDVVNKNTSFPGVIGEMVQPIIPAVLSARADGGDLLDNSVRSNARRVANRLKTQSQVIEAAMKGGKVKIASAHYRLSDGEVTWLEES